MFPLKGISLLSWRYKDPISHPILWISSGVPAGYPLSYFSPEPRKPIKTYLGQILEALGVTFGVGVTLVAAWVPCRLKVENKLMARDKIKSDVRTPRSLTPELLTLTPLKVAISLRMLSRIPSSGKSILHILYLFIHNA